MARGAPTKFKEEYIDQAVKLAKLGATDVDLADFFEVHEDTIYEWKKVYPHFSEALKSGKEFADSRVVRSLYERATGYSHREDKFFMHEGKILTQETTKHYPPDPTSIVFWLSNRRPNEWRRNNSTGDTNEPIQVEVTRVRAKKDSD